jgi:hypothetical protein
MLQWNQKDCVDSIYNLSRMHTSAALNVAAKLPKRGATLKGIQLKGFSDEQAIQITKEFLESAGVSESDRLPINSREDALLALFTISKVAERFDVASIFKMEIEANEEFLAARVAA